jgi:hypothetical protein
MAADVTLACSSEPPEAAPPPSQRIGGFCQLVRVVSRRLTCDNISVRYCFDTSALNSLYNDPDRDAIVTGMLAGASFCISAYNVIEAAKTRDPGRRQQLVRFMRRLADNKRPLNRPNDLIRAVARAYASRDATGYATVTLNADENINGLWIALNDPTLIDEEAREELLAWAEQWEDDYDGIVARGRERFQELFGRRPDQRPRTAATTIRSFMLHDDQIYSQLVRPIYEQETGKQLARADYDNLMKEPSWSLYLAGYAYGLHQRAVRTEGYSRSKNAGAVDLGQAVYLGWCDRFVTSDRAQYRALRLLRCFNRPAGRNAELWTYEGFRKRLLVFA